MSYATPATHIEHVRASGKAASPKPNKTPRTHFASHTTTMKIYENGEELGIWNRRLSISSDGDHSTNLSYGTIVIISSIIILDPPSPPPTINCCVKIVNNHEPKQAAISHHGHIGCGRSRPPPTSWYGWICRRHYCVLHSPN